MPFVFSKVLRIATGLLVTLCAGQMSAQTDTTHVKKSDRPEWLPQVSGTVRAKAEYQLNEGQGRFQVRNARIALEGKVVPMVKYKAEIDLSDEGKIKMLDAYVGLLPLKGMQLRAGQMRVPFSIDAHRSPHKQYFANRSFIAKQVGNVRDVGFYAAYTFPDIPLSMEAGVFNGSGLTNQKDYWTKDFNFSAKVQYSMPWGVTLETSVQKISPMQNTVYLYDAGITWRMGRWILECEYLRKNYLHKAFKPVNAFDAFVCYEHPLRKFFQKVSFLCRYDCMDNHSDGSVDEDGVMKQTDPARQRLTGGLTLSMAKKMNADIRINYEKYWYDEIQLAKPSERDKIVVELVVHFPNR